MAVSCVNWGGSFPGCKYCKCLTFWRLRDRVCCESCEGLVTHRPPPWSLDHGTQNLFSLQQTQSWLNSARRGKLLIHHSFNPSQYKLYICELGPVSQSRCVSPFSDWSPVFTLSVRTPAPAPGSANHTIRCHKAPTVPRYKDSSLDNIIFICSRSSLSLVKSCQARKMLKWEEKSFYSVFGPRSIMMPGYPIMLAAVINIILAASKSQNWIPGLISTWLSIKVVSCAG